MQQNRLQSSPTKAERENSNDDLQTGSASATKTEAENQDGGLQTGIEITYILATLHHCNENQMVIHKFSRSGNNSKLQHTA